MNMAFLPRFSSFHFVSFSFLCFFCSFVHFFSFQLPFDKIQYPPKASNALIHLKSFPQMENQILFDGPSGCDEMFCSCPPNYSTFFPSGAGFSFSFLVVGFLYNYLFFFFSCPHDSTRACFSFFFAFFSLYFSFSFLCSSQKLSFFLGKRPLFQPEWTMFQYQKHEDGFYSVFIERFVVKYNKRKLGKNEIM